MPLQAKVAELFSRDQQDGTLRYVGVGAPGGEVLLEEDVVLGDL